MKFLEIVVITVPAVIMFAVVMSVITKTTISDFDTYIAVSITGLVSLWIAYYFHKKDTPAQRTWNEKRKETMEEMLDLLEQLSRQIRVGSHYLEKDMHEIFQMFYDHLCRPLNVQEGSFRIESSLKQLRACLRRQEGLFQF